TKERNPLQSTWKQYPSSSLNLISNRWDSCAMICALGRGGTHEDELPQNLKKSQENESKAAAKNRKKREAKARSKQEEENQPTSQVVENAPQSPSAPAAAVSGDNDKKIRNLKKKLRQIEELKTQQKAGKQLEVNQ
ncbi:predicted protein, partial [Nematostella vectensis]